MGSSEFTHWLEFMRGEAIGPGSEVGRWAELMAGVANGPLRKKDKSMFRATDFLPHHATKAKPPPAASGQDARAFVRSLRNQ